MFPLSRRKRPDMAKVPPPPRQGNTMGNLDVSEREGLVPLNFKVAPVI
jgi:hypothetical protein